MTLTQKINKFRQKYIGTEDSCTSFREIPTIGKVVDKYIYEEKGKKKFITVFDTPFGKVESYNKYLHNSVFKDLRYDVILQDTKITTLDYDKTYTQKVPVSTERMRMITRLHDN